MSLQKRWKDGVFVVYNSQPLRSEDQINDVLFYLRRTRYPERDTFLFLLGINTGLRCSDLLNLKVGTLRHSKRPEIVEIKTGKKKTLFLDAIYPKVEQYIMDKADEDWVFPSSQNHGAKPESVNNVYKLFKRIDANLGNIGFTTHSMRRTFGLWYYRKTHDILYLMRLFNHSSEEITKRYIGITDEELGDSLREFKIGF